MNTYSKTLFLGCALGLSLATACGDDDTSGSGSTADPTSADDTAGVDTTAGGGGFEFAEDDPASYSRVDRVGLPAVNTALITSKDAYNQGEPADDADFVPEISANVTALHDALDDDITALGLVPCAPAACLEVAGPIAIPDMLKINPAEPAGFPNGRQLEDQALDIILAVLLLDLGTDGQDAGTLAGVPLNPPENDVPFSSTFPYLADPHG